MEPIELKVLHMKSWPIDGGGYTGFFAITAKDQNTIELLEQTKDSKFDKFVFLQLDGTTYIATDLLLEYSSVTKDELLKIVQERSKDSLWEGHVKFWFGCKEISQQKI
jgi:hypothetical protein